MNILIKYLDKYKHTVLVISGLILFCLLPIGWIMDIFGLSFGYSMLWLIYLYIVGAYFNKYQIGKLFKQKIWLIVYIVSVIIAWIIYLIFDIVPILSGFSDIVLNYNFPTTLFMGIGLFCFFVNMEIKNKNVAKLIILLAPVSFGVYLVHVHPVIFNYVIKDLFIPFIHYPTIIMVLMILGTAFIIYIVCSCIDMIRIKLFQLFKIDYISNKIVIFLHKGLDVLLSINILKDKIS
jgi:hypothetical protein